jgi:DNA-binding NtrC family response regulator
MTGLTGCVILVVDEEPLVALDIAQCLQSAGASVQTAHCLADGLCLAEHRDLSAAVLDYRFSDGEGTVLCERLKELNVPFVLHTGYAQIEGACGSGLMLPKPATRGQLISAVMRILSNESS